MEEKKEEIKPIAAPSPVTLEDVDSRIKALNEKTAELKAENDRMEKLLMNQRLAGVSGGHIETRLTPEQIKENEGKKRADEIVKAFRR